MDVTIRSARYSDLEACYRIWLLTEGIEPAGNVGRYPLHEHELSTGQLLVAESRDGVVVGFAGSLQRDGLQFLADVFVHPDRHGTGLGRRLLDELFRDQWSPRCALASSDPRAVPLYASFGMLPRWPSYTVVIAGDDAVRLDVGAAPNPIDVDDAATFDREVFGRDRTLDFEYWQHTYDVTVMEVRNRGHRSGVGVLRRRSPYAPVFGDAAVVGPVLCNGDADPAEVVGALVRTAGQLGARRIRVPVPGPHPALAMLLRAGGRIHDMDMFCASHDDIVDPERHTLSVDLL